MCGVGRLKQTEVILQTDYDYFLCLKLVVFSLIFLGGCSLTTLRGEGIMSDITLTQADSGKSMTIRHGETMKLILNENPSTGFQWKIEQSNEDILKLQTSKYSLPDKTRAGITGERVFTFLANNSGKTRLILKYWRAWEGDKSTIEHFEANFEVIKN